MAIKEQKANKDSSLDVNAPTPLLRLACKFKAEYFELYFPILSALNNKTKVRPWDRVLES